MFYTKVITTFEHTQGYVNDNGVWVEGGYKPLNKYKVDVQPYSSELAFKEYGYEGDVKYRIYCPIIDEITKNSIIEYRGTKYRVVMDIHWDDYMILIVSDKDD